MQDAVPYRKNIRSANAIPTVFGMIVVLAASLILLAWLAGMDANDWLFLMLLQMKANTALCLSMLGLSLVLASGNMSIRSPIIVFLLSFLPFCIAAITLLEYLLVWESGLSRLLSPDARSVAYPGRMAPLTTVAIIVYSLAMFSQLRFRREWIKCSQVLALAGVVLATVTLLGYLYGASSLIHFLGYTPMARNTAILMLMLGIGILTLHPESGLVAPLFGKTVSAQMGRRLLFLVILCLPLLAWIRMKGQAMQLYSAEFGTALVVTICLVMMSVLIMIHTFRANQAEVRLHYLNRVYSVLSEVNSLIVRACSREELFFEAHRIVIERGAFPRAWLGLINAERTAVDLIAGNEKIDLTSESLVTRLSLEQGATGLSPIAQTVLTGLPVVSNDVAAEGDDPFRREMLANNIYSFAIFPLLLDGHVIGIFKLHAEVPNFFHEEELRLLGELAGDITFAIHHLEQKQILDHLAYFDSLTGLANPRLLEERLGQAIEYAVSGSTLAVVVMDVIAFKAINDAFGRQVGDETLKHIARRLNEVCGDTNNGRLGSNLFAIHLNGMYNDATLAKELERIHDFCFSRKFNILGNSFVLSARSGIALLGVDGTDARTLLNNAEAAIASAKASGQRYRFYDLHSNLRNAERLALQAALVQGIENNEFQLHYQIKVESKSFAICGAEALLRWNSHSLGKIEPSRFVPLLEETGLIEKVGEWALRQASADNSQNISNIIPGFRIAVNVSASQLLQHDFVEKVQLAFGKYAALADIDLELTESLIMTDVEKSINKLQRLRDLGIRIAVDDFGTGYSSMAYLAKLPLDYLKIDRSFITGLPDDQECITVTSSIISLGHALGLQVIAEGIEHPGQAIMLASLGCDQLQGYLFGKPVPITELLDRLSAPDEAVAIESVKVTPG